MSSEQIDQRAASSSVAANNRQDHPVANQQHLAHPHPSGFGKADISFFRGFIKYRKTYRILMVIHLVQILAFSAFIPIDTILQNPTQKIVAAEAVALAISVVCLFITILQYYIIFRKYGTLGYCQMARDTMHSCAEPILNYDQIQSCTSQTILHAATGVTINGLDQKTIELYSNATIGEIDHVLDERFPQVASWEKAYQFFSLTGMIIIIILMADSSSLNAAEIAVLTIYLVIEGCIKIKLLFILLAIALSPIICILAIFYLCCCKPKNSEGEVSVLDLQSQQATMEEVVLSQGGCAICLMDIKVKDKVYKLKCSNKHIFHEGCLSKWANVKLTCPTCRAQLPNRPVQAADINRQ